MSKAATQPALRIVDWSAQRGDQAGGAGWQIERWGPVGNASVQMTGRAAGAALRATVISLDQQPAPAQLVHPVAFAAGHAYRVSIELSSEQPVVVEVLARAKPAPYEAMAVRTLTVGREWQTVVFDTAWPVPAVAGDVRVAARGPQADILVRRLTVDDLGRLPLGSPQARPFSSMLLGVHVNKLGQHATWPSFGPGLVRLWDTGTNWHHLAPSAEEFRSERGVGWDRLDAYVRYVRAHSGSAALLFTLGQPPAWASDSPDAVCAYGTGTCGGPVSVAEWRHYVRTLARRYKGRIRHWELWNEPDHAPFFQSSRSLVELAAVAREELKAVDPQNQLISPGFTNYGLRALEDFLRAGGGPHVDAIAFHWYFNGTPERLAPMIFNVRQLMAAYGVGDKPLWNTEGSPLCQERRNGRCLLDGLTEEEIGVTVERAIVTQWLNGVAAFAYYFLEGMEGRTVSLLTPDFKSASRAGDQLAMFARWLVGAVAVEVSTFGVDGHVVLLQRGDRRSYLVWSEAPGVRLSVPVEWNATTQQSLGDAPRPLAADRLLTVGRIPMLISSDVAGHGGGKRAGRSTEPTGASNTGRVAA